MQSPSLADYLPTIFPGRDRLLAYAAALRSTASGETVWQNFDESLRTGLVAADLFARFCARLGPLLPLAVCNREERKRLEEALDEPEVFYFRGPALVAEPALSLSNVLRAEQLSTKWQGAPTTLPLSLGSERSDQRRRWRLDPVVPTVVDITLGGTRPFFWVAPTTEVEGQAPLPPLGLTAPEAADAAQAQASRLREIMGLKYLWPGSDVFELRMQAGDLGVIHRPTVLDALDYDAFRPVESLAPWLGWGRTRDLAAPDSVSSGVPEAVTPAAAVPCHIVYRGDIPL